MCCTGICRWERNDYTNGGTTCRKPPEAQCFLEDYCEYCEEKIENCTCDINDNEGD